ncbi:MAG: Ig domain-containing protein [Clostridium butyricum]|nr:Ig domain-containing protein [Clostridium butyricum]
MIKSKKYYKIIGAVILASIMNISMVSAGTTNNVLSNEKVSLKKIAGVSLDTVSEDGGAAEIMKYNKDNNKVYVINGVKSKVFVASLDGLKNGESNFKVEKSIDIKPLVEKDGFTYGDITSIAISNSRKEIAVAVQAKEYNKNGKIVVMDYEGNLKKVYNAGVQPDMVTYTNDSKYLLTANEGEPRLGISANVEDPKGSATIVNLENGSIKLATFDKFNSERASLVAKGVLISKGVNPSEDFEPEYMAIDSSNKYAYVTLQENNSIATLDIEKGEFVSVDSLGVKSNSALNNAIDVVKDGKIDIKTQNLYSTYMPDSIAFYEVNGKKYLLTANEGDGREYIQEENANIKLENEYNNISSIMVEGKKVEVINKDVVDGLEKNKNYLFGGRSFSIWDAETKKIVFDSGSDFEKITAQKFQKYFNCSNDNIELDSRSGKKGPEAEEVKVSKVGDKVYAYIGLERIGGVMVYDITNPSKATFKTYINTREFTDNIAGDVAPECIDIINEEYSKTGNTLIAVSNEVSGTISILEQK